MKRNIRFFISFVLAVFFIHTNVQAQNVVGFSVTGGGQALAGVPVEAVANGMSVDYSMTNDNGYGAFYNLPDGIYDIRVNISQTYDCTPCQLFSDKTFEDQEVISGQGGEVDLGNFDLAAATKTLTVYVKSNGIGIADMEVFASEAPVMGPGTGTTMPPGDGPPPGEGDHPDTTYSLLVEADTPEFKFGRTDVTGKIIFGIKNGGKWMINAMDPNGEYTESFTETSLPDGDGNTDVILNVKGTDSSVTLNLVDQSSNPVVLADNQYAFASCQTEFDMPDPGAGPMPPTTASEPPLFFSGNLNPGESSTVINLVGGTVEEPEKYLCTIFLDTAAADSASVSVISGDEKSVNIKTYSTDYVVNVQFVDQQGLAISDVNAGIFAFTEPDAPVNHCTNGNATNGSGQLKLVEHQELEYNLNYFIENNDMGGVPAGQGTASILQDGSGNEYIGSFEFITIKTTPGTSPQNVDIVLKKADATLNVTVKANGQAMANTWVDVVSGDIGMPDGLMSAEDEAPIFLGGMTDQNGQVSLKVLSGKEYLVQAWIDPFSNPDLLNPAPQKVTPASGETKEVLLEAKVPDVTLTVSLSAPEGADALDWAYCAAHNDDAQTFAEIISPNFTGMSIAANEGTLKLVGSDDPYNLFCEGGNSSKLYSVKTTYATQEGVSTDTVSLTLEEGGIFYPSQSITFDAGSAQSVTFPDGCSAISFPAKSLADSGNVTLTFGTNKDALPNTDDISGFMMFDFSIKKTGDGSAITDVNPPATIVLCYDEANLPEGLDESQIGCVGSNEQGTGLSKIASCEVDTEANTVTFSVNHFSDYGLNISAAADDSPSPSPSPSPNPTAEPPEGGTVDPPAKVIARKNDLASTAARTSVKLIWRKVPDATGYVLRITKTKGKAEPVIKYKNVKKGKKRKIKKSLKLRKPGAYTFAVASKDADGLTGTFSGESKKIRHRKKRPQ